MGNVIDSFASGFAAAIGNLFNGSIDFLSGKSCSSICGSTWDFICYIEHFCVADLLKLALTILVLYIVLLFWYLSYKLGIFHCVCHTLCKIPWACFSMCFHICHLLCQSLLRPRRRRRRTRHKKDVEDLENFEYSSQENDEDNKARGEISSENYGSRRSPSLRWRDHRRRHLRRSLRPRNYRVQVKVSHLSGGGANKLGNKNHYMRNSHRIRVTHTSKFAQKGKNNYSISVHRDRG